MSSIITSVAKKISENEYEQKFLGSRPAYIGATQGNVITDAFNFDSGVQSLDRKTGVSNLEEQLLLGTSYITHKWTYEDTGDSEVISITKTEYRNRDIDSQYYFTIEREYSLGYLLKRKRAEFLEGALVVPDAGYDSHRYSGATGTLEEGVLELDDAYNTKKSKQHYTVDPDDNDGILIKNKYATDDYNLVVKQVELWYRPAAAAIVGYRHNVSGDIINPTDYAALTTAQQAVYTAIGYEEVVEEFNFDNLYEDTDYLIAIKNVYQQLEDGITDSDNGSLLRVTNKEEIVQPKVSTDSGDTYGYMTGAVYRTEGGGTN